MYNKRLDNIKSHKRISNIALLLNKQHFILYSLIIITFTNIFTFYANYSKRKAYGHW